MIPSPSLLMGAGSWLGTAVIFHPTGSGGNIWTWWVRILMNFFFHESDRWDVNMTDLKEPCLSH